MEFPFWRFRGSAGTFQGSYFRLSVVMELGAATVLLFLIFHSRLV